MLMNAFHASFHESRGRRPIKYVFSTGNTYLLNVQRVGLTLGPKDPDPVAVLFQQEDGAAWKVKIASESNWNEQASFSMPGEDLFEEIRGFFVDECDSLINMTRTLTSLEEEERSEQWNEPDVMPFESEISEDGTLVRCSKCGSAEIVFPDLHTCTRCGADIIQENRYSPRGDLEKSVSTTHGEIQAETATIGKCMVCDFRIHQGESLLTCVHCQGKAHRTHLLEYVHVKGQCPSCGAHLSEGELTWNPAAGEGTGDPQKPRRRVRRGPSPSGATQ